MYQIFKYIKNQLRMKHAKRKMAGKRGLTTRKAGMKRKFGESSHGKLVTFFQGTPPYQPYQSLNRKRKGAMPSTGLQNDRTNTPILANNKNPNKREGGMSDLAISVAQQINPRPSSKF